MAQVSENSLASSVEPSHHNSTSASKKRSLRPAGSTRSCLDTNSPAHCAVSALQAWSSENRLQTGCFLGVLNVQTEQHLTDMKPAEDKNSMPALSEYISPKLTFRQSAKTSMQSSDFPSNSVNILHWTARWNCLLALNFSANFHARCLPFLSVGKRKHSTICSLCCIWYLLWFYVILVADKPPASLKL